LPSISFLRNTLTCASFTIEPPLPAPFHTGAARTTITDNFICRDLSDLIVAGHQRLRPARAPVGVSPKFALIEHYPAGTKMENLNRLCGAFRGISILERSYPIRPVWRFAGMLRLPKNR
jgi:hypothetical protein